MGDYKLVTSRGEELDLKEDILPVLSSMSREDLLDVMRSAVTAMDALLDALARTSIQVQELERALNAHRRGEARWADGRNNEGSVDG